MANSVEYKKFTELDFQNIKESLKTHLRSQDVLKDIDFEGSVSTVLLNVLAYNTQYMAYHLNMGASEKFISTGQKRESVVGSANNIGYVPFSRKSGTAYLSFIINTPMGYANSIYIPKNTKFIANLDGTDYSFLTTQNTTVIPVNSVYSVTDLEVKEGRFFSYSYNIKASDKFLTIPNKGVDYSRIVVSVKESNESVDTAIYSEYQTLLELSSTSEVYFIQEGSGGYAQIYFGDGILGKAISVGNVVTVEYYISQGDSVNGINNFVLSDSVSGIQSLKFTNVISASGGSNEESLDSIRISAPTNYQAQNRAITELDYEVLVKKIYPNSKQISAIGGQRYTPKQYGKVFISILKDDLNILSDKDKADILLQLNTKYAGLTVIPQIVDPYIIRMYINSVVKYKNDKSSSAEIKTAVFNRIKQFVSTDLNSFKYTLRKSRFESMIDDVSDAILSNNSTFRLYIDTNDTIIPTKSNFVNFSQSIVPKSIQSGLFTYKTIPNCEFIDVNGLGFASIYTKSVTGELSLVLLNALSIDYNSGLINYTDTSYSLHSLSLQNFSGIKISVQPLSEDVSSIDNTVIYVKDADITVTPLIDA